MQPAANSTTPNKQMSKVFSLWFVTFEGGFQGDYVNAALGASLPAYDEVP